MVLTIKIKLLPTSDQSIALLKTIKEANACCNTISATAWERQVFNQFKLHKEVYYPIKNAYKLSSQLIIRCISKVSNSYKLNKRKRCEFRNLGGIAYDGRILSYSGGQVSIWSIDGRLKIPFICNRPNLLQHIKGEAVLIYKKNKFFLLQAAEIPIPELKSVDGFIGVDFGLTNIAVTSNGIKHSAIWLNNYREKRQRVRSSIQSKGTKGATRSSKRSCRRLLKRLKGKERTTATIQNHSIAKHIIATAKNEGKGIAIEDLANIRFTTNRKSKKVKAKIGRWSFRQLRSFLEYKSIMEGVRLVLVNPAYTSQTCSECHHIGKRTNALFKCENCGHNEDADINASKNIATLGAAVNQPEKSEMYSCSVHYSGLKHA